MPLRWRPMASGSVLLEIGSFSQCDSDLPKESA